MQDPSSADVQTGQPTHVVPARPSALLILVRDAEQGMEVLMMRRSHSVGFAPGAYVFPGGTVDASDRSVAWCEGSMLDPTIACRHLDVQDAGLAYWVTAIRECFEESGILLATDAAGALVRTDDPVVTGRLVELRQQLNAARLGFDDVCRAAGLRPAFERLTYFSHWITPMGLPRRYDTRCFIAEAPPAQAAVHDASEMVGHCWVRPADALERYRRGEFEMVNATLRTLEQLTVYRRADDVLARERPPGSIKPIQPRRADGRSGTKPIGPEHAAYDEVGRIDPWGVGGGYYDILPDVPVRLAEGLIRLTAPNPGYMTGPGTNSYLISNQHDTWIIDPGPDDEAHVQALLAHAPSPITQVLVTHTHIDHSPAARRIKALTGAQLLGLPPPASGQDQTFAPDYQPAHQEILMSPRGRLKVLYTPGHAANHLCYLLEPERLLFTGDHVMQGSTVVVSPPDGDMQQYLDTLERLLLEDLAWLAPAHGFTMHKPEAVIRGLIKHRLQREKLIADALRTRGPATLDTLLPRVYMQLSGPLLKVAARSLLAHLLRMEGCGQVVKEGESWKMVG